MSNHHFIECLSLDPFIRSLGRQVSRLMNDPTLGTHQRQRLVSKVQERLLSYQAQQLVNAQKKGEKKSRRESTTRHVEGNVAADPKGLIARRKEFGLIDGAIQAPAAGQEPQQSDAANDAQVTGWHQPLLTLKRA
jgi:hypothetical protein